MAADPALGDRDERGAAPTRSLRAWLHAARTPPPQAPAPIIQVVPPPPAEPRTNRLASMSPFAIGFFGMVGAMVAWGLFQAAIEIRSILLLIVVSLFLALGLNPIVEWLAGRRVPRPLAVTVVAVVGLGLIVLAASALVPLLTAQINELVANAPRYVQGLRQNPQIARLDERYGIIDKLSQALASGSLMDTVFGGILGAGKLLANTVFNLIVTTVLTIYFLGSLPSIKEVIYRLAPASRRDRVRYLANEMFSRIGGYLSGMFIVVTVAATCAFIFMLIAGLGEYALALAFVVAMFAFIPLVGSSCSMVVVAIVGFSVKPAIGIAAIIYFLIYQQFEAYVIQPRVMQRSVRVPGAIVIVAALAGGALLGIVGALIAIPTAAALLLLYREVLAPHLDSR